MKIYQSTEYGREETLVLGECPIHRNRLTQNRGTIHIVESVLSILECREFNKGITLKMRIDRGSYLAIAITSVESQLHVLDLSKVGEGIQNVAVLSFFVNITDN